MFICGADVNYVETPSYHSKLYNITTRKLVKNAVKLCRKFFLYKINTDMQKSQG